MSISMIEQMNIYFTKNSDKYSYSTLEYGRWIILSLVENGGTIFDFFIEKDIPITRFLDELLPLAEYKLKRTGSGKITIDDFEEIINFLSIEHDINILVEDEHIDTYIMDDNGEQIYIPDQYTVDFFKERYDIELVPYEPFDFNIFYEEKKLSNDLTNLDNICWN
jgi:hypothetical protein